MRAILVGVRYSVYATSQAIMFTSSLLVSATMMSASARAGGFEHRGIGGVAGDGADVEAVLQIAQHFFVGVDDRDFVGFFAGEVVGRGAPDLAGAEDHDLHGARIVRSERGLARRSGATCPRAEGRIMARLMAHGFQDSRR